MAGAGMFAAVILFFADWIFWHLGGVLFGYDDFVFSFNLILPEGQLRVPVVLYLALTAGFVEEVIFRGLFWTAISEWQFKRFKPFIYVFSSSLVFASVHWEQGMAGMLSSFAFGIVAAMFYLRLRNLWPMITAHTLIDIYYFW